jgi:NADPH:quinone reductase-like Zn-dependent oxidoreductase
MDFVRKLGADEVIDYQKEDTVQRVIAITNGEGVDYVLDTGLKLDSFFFLFIHNIPTSGR